jgi:hypothetical protein
MAETGRIHLVEPAPPRCSSCWQQKPQKRHIDFGASWDGPTFPPFDNVAGGVVSTIDDLIICEDCIRDAAKLIGLGEHARLQQQLAELEQANERLHARNDELAAIEAQAQKLRESLEPVTSR